MIYINKIVNNRPIVERTTYPYNIPVIKNLFEFKFNSNITFIVGENGSGKSTFVEAIAVCAGFNPEGGGIYLNHHTYDTHSNLYCDMKLIRSGYRNADGFFLRAESFYNAASKIDSISDMNQLIKNYGGPIHERSHGEGFLGVILNRLSVKGLYIFDEPESALSLSSLFKFIVKLKQLEQESQFIIATHSPILLAYPNAEIYNITENGFELTKYEDTDQYQLTKFFINNYHHVINELLY